MATESEMLPVLRMLAAAYPNNKLTPESFAVYMVMLADVPISDLKRGVVWALSHNQFFPSVSEIRQAVMESSETRPPDHDEAWGEVMRQIYAVGSYGIPRFSHQSITQAVNSIGWREICLSEDISIIRGQFRKIYETCSTRIQNQAAALTTEKAERAMLQMSNLAHKMALPGGK